MDLEWPPEQYRRELAMASQNSIVRSELNSSYERLKAALRRCQKRDDIRHGIPELSNMQPCGCRAILCHIDRAMLSHGQRGRLLSNRVERMMSRAAPVAEQVLASMPDEICVLHGGLAVLFKVTESRSANINRILTTLGNVRRDLAELSETIEQFKGHTELLARANDMITVLEDTSSKLINLLLEKGFRNWIKLSTKRHDIDEEIKKLDVAREAFDRCAGRLYREAGIDTRTIAQRLERQLTQVRRDVAEQGQVTREVRRSVDIVAENGRILHQDIRTMSMGMERIPSELQRMLDTQAATLATTFTNALDAFADRFEQMLSHAKIRWTRQERQRLNLSNARLRQLRNTRITSSPATCTINPSDFISLVGVPPLTAMDDIRVASQHRFDQRSIGQVNSITGQASFGYWIYDKTSSFLLVEACLPNAPKLSAMSLFCAQFAQNISKAQAGVSLVHFCGKHLYQDERLDGPVGLIRNLITQLVVYLHAVHEVHLDHLFDDEDCHRAAEGDLDALWDLFRQLLCEVPADVPVFCIIDGISFIGNSWRDETQKLVRYLHDMVDDDAVDAMFKVLLTCPSRLTTDMPFISSERRIRLSPGDSAQRPDMHQAFNEMTRVVFSSNLQSKDRVDSGIGVEEEELPWQPKGSEF